MKFSLIISRFKFFLTSGSLELETRPFSRMKEKGKERFIGKQCIVEQARKNKLKTKNNQKNKQTKKTDV